VSKIFSEEELKNLIEIASKARENAHAPFSNFKVGAAVVTENGEIYSGCNVESASYGLTVCAERVAIWKAVSEGHCKFSGIVVVADTKELTPPCGTCRQIIWEFGGDMPIVFANLNGKYETFTSGELLPHAFDNKYLKA
jgi:cytidine deaminase